MKALIVVLLLGLTGCAARPAAKNEAPSDEVVIISTSDFHSSLERAEGLASVVRGLKAKYGERMLYLDAGDLFQGSLEGNMSKGRSIVEFFNQIGLDAAAMGNHELDYGTTARNRVSVRAGEDGLGNLKARMRQAHFKWLSANFVHDSTQKPVFDTHAVFQRAGKKVCVIGATTPSTVHITNPDFIRGNHFEPLAPTIEREARTLREKEHCDFVVLTVHAGLLCEDGSCLQEGDRAEMVPLLKTLPRGTLDAVVSGHNHLQGKAEVNGTPVVQPGSHAGAVGVLHLSKSHYEIESFIPVPQTVEGQSDVTALLKPYRDAAARMKAERVGQTTGEFFKDYPHENALANLVADALLEAGRPLGAQLALVNAGGLRFGLPKGEIRYGDVFKVLPFDNSLTVVELTGAQLRRCLEISLSGGHGVSGIAGIRVRRRNVPTGARGEWDRDLNEDGVKQDWERALLLEIRDAKGQLIRDTAKYRLVTLDFIVRGGDHQEVLFRTISDAAKHFHEGVWQRDVLIQYLKKHPSISPHSYYDPRRPRVELVD